MVDPMNPGSFPTEPVQEPGFFAKIWDAIKGFFGFGTSSSDATDVPVIEEPGTINNGGMKSP